MSKRQREKKDDGQGDEKRSRIDILVEEMLKQEERDFRLATGRLPKPRGMIST